MSNVSEELLQLRKRARRRLVGAIALVVFALIVLWTALDGEPPANLAASRPVEIVSSSSNLASTVIAVPLQQKAVVPAASEVSVTVTPVAVATSILPGKIVNRQTEVDDSIAAPVVTPTRKPAAASRVQTTPKPTSKPTSKPVVTPVQRDPRLILEGRDEEPVKAAAASAKFFVQVAAFADAAKASQTVAKLKKAGLPAYPEKVKTGQGELTRVRIGPAPDRARAAAWLKKAQTLGVSGQVVGK